MVDRVTIDSCTTNSRTFRIKFHIRHQLFSRTNFWCYWNALIQFIAFSLNCQLPTCLCIHISRNTWNSGAMSKRQDYVQFPMRLSLAAYTFLRVQYQRKLTNSLYTSTSEGGSPLSSSMPTAWGAGHSLSEADFRHIYQLMAVVVHAGDAHSGHFITYRKGHQNTK